MSRDFTRAHVSHSTFLSILLTQQFALTQVTPPPLGTDGANNGEVSEKFDSAEEEVCFTRAHVSHSIFLSILLTQQFSLRRSLRRSRRKYRSIEGCRGTILGCRSTRVYRSTVSFGLVSP